MRRFIGFSLLLAAIGITIWLSATVKHPDKLHESNSLACQRLKIIEAAQDRNIPIDPALADAALHHCGRNLAIDKKVPLVLAAPKDALKDPCEQMGDWPYNQGTRATKDAIEAKCVAETAGRVRNLPAVPRSYNRTGIAIAAMVVLMLTSLILVGRLVSRRMRSQDWNYQPGERRDNMGRLPGDQRYNPYQ